MAEEKEKKLDKEFIDWILESSVRDILIRSFDENWSSYFTKKWLDLKRIAILEGGWNK